MKKIIAISALMAAMASANALAADANLTFTGSVSTGTCIMNSADATKTLTIPDAPESGITALGFASFTTYSASSTINFSGCPSTSSTVTGTVSGTTGTVVNGSGAAASLPASGTAKGVALVLTLGDKSNGYMFVDGSNSRSFPISAAGVASIPVNVGIAPSSAWDSTQPTVSAGNYSSSYTVTFTYS